MKTAVLALATAATIGVTALATPSPAYAWRGGWGGWGGGLAGGLIAGAVIGGIASTAYAYGPGYGRLLWRAGVRLLWPWRLCPCIWLRSRILRRIWVPARGSPGIRILRPSVLSRVSLRLVIVKVRR